MPIATTCQHCRTNLTVADDFEGQLVRCPRCDQVFSVSRCGASEATGISLTDQQVTDDRANRPAIAETDSNVLATSCWLMRTPEGNQYGPADEETLDRWVSEGRVTDDCQLQQLNSDVWQPAGERYPVLVEAGNPFARQDYRGVKENLDPHRGNFVLTLALAGCVVPFVSIWAAIMGTQDLRRMQAGRMDANGEVPTKAGQVIATVASMIWIGAFAITLLVLIFRAMQA